MVKYQISKARLCTFILELFLIFFVSLTLAHAQETTDETIAQEKAKVKQPWQKAAWIQELRKKKFSEVYKGEYYALNELQLQINQAIANGKKELRLKPGIYVASKDEKNNTIINLKNLVDFSIDATGVVLLSEKPRRFLQLNQCERVTIKGLIMDNTAEGLPFTQGTITAINKDSVEVVIHQGFPMPKNRDNTTRKIDVLDAETLLLTEGVWTLYDVKYQINNRTVILDKKAIIPGIQVGKYVALFNEEPIAHGVLIDNSKNITLQDVVIHCAPMFAILTLGCEEITYQKVKITPGPMFEDSEIPRVKSGNQDGIHIIDMKGKGDLVENCTIECHSDDAIAINSGYSLVLKKNDKTNFVVSKHGQINLQVGDKIRHTRLSDMQNLQESKVVSVERIADSNLITELSKDKDELCKKYNIRASDFSNRSYFKVVLDSSHEIEGGEFMGLESGNFGLVVRNNYIANHRARSFLLKTSGALIENNLVFHCMDTPVTLGPERFWSEGGYSRDMIIRNNRFINCGYGGNMPNDAMIRISGMGEKGAVAKAGNHKNILIENNHFLLCNSMPISIMATSGLKIRNNIFKYTHFRKVIERNGFNIDQKKVYWLYNVDDVEISGNRVEGAGQYLSKEKLFSINVNKLTYTDKNE